MALLIILAPSHFFRHRNSPNSFPKIMSNEPSGAPDAPAVTLKNDNKESSVDSVVRMVMSASNLAKLKKLVAYKDEKRLWGMIRCTLRGWAIASSPYQFRGTDLSKPQRKFAYMSSFDIRKLLDSERDLVVLLACTKVKPLSHKNFLKVYLRCCTTVPLGKNIRNILQNKFNEDKFVSQVLWKQTSAGLVSSG
jgi:hypothetical protein